MLSLLFSCISLFDICGTRRALVPPAVWRYERCPNAIRRASRPGLSPARPSITLETSNALGGLGGPSAAPSTFPKSRIRQQGGYSEKDTQIPRTHPSGSTVRSVLLSNLRVLRKRYWCGPLSSASQRRRNPTAGRSSQPTRHALSGTRSISKRLPGHGASRRQFVRARHHESASASRSWPRHCMSSGSEPPRKRGSRRRARKSGQQRNCFTSQHLRAHRKIPRFLSLREIQGTQPHRTDAQDPQSLRQRRFPTAWQRRSRHGRGSNVRHSPTQPRGDAARSPRAQRRATPETNDRLAFAQSRVQAKPCTLIPSHRKFSYHGTGIFPRAIVSLGFHLHSRCHPEQFYVRDLRFLVFELRFLQRN